MIGNRDPSYAEFDSLVYAQCVFREALRLYPPVVALTKRAAQDTTLSGGYFVPKGVRE